jgi:hypothetical protein
VKGLSEDQESVSTRSNESVVGGAIDVTISHLKILHSTPGVST